MVHVVTCLHDVVVLADGLHAARAARLHAKFPGDSRKERVVVDSLHEYH